MAEQGTNDKENNWYTSLMGVVDTIELESGLREDLDELSEVVTKDAQSTVNIIKDLIVPVGSTSKEAVEGESSVPKPAINLSISNLTNTIGDFLSQAVVITDETDNGAQGYGTYDQKLILMDRKHVHITSLLSNPQAFLEVEEDDDEDKRKSILLIDHKDDIDALLETYKNLKELYEAQVPSKATHEKFWKCFFYELNRRHDEDAKRKEAFKNRTTAEKDEVELLWDDEVKTEGDRNTAKEDDKPKDQEKIEDYDVVGSSVESSEKNEEWPEWE
ncbi:hypothetical protein MP638_004390 [Amoeboaphelidium occidentale]|nr:hypothetical protein MP638_004390 [Amoeboaphelidium occidentale]